MDSGRSTRALPRVGFPIRRSRDQRLVSTSPGLIAAAHVLHRLLAPRHPPCALVLLIRKNTFYCRYGVFKVRVSSNAHEKTPLSRCRRQCRRHRAGLSKLNSVSDVGAAQRGGERRSHRGRRCSRRAQLPGRPWSHRTDWTPTGVRAPVFPRKEVIQPQLPLRLPCYDFTPIINPTFDGCLPEGLAHRLRVLPTFVV
jgi:hypothetical protein